MRIGRRRALSSPSKATGPRASAATGGKKRITVPAKPQSIAVLPDPARGKAMTDVELTNWADQVLKKRIENVRGVGASTLVGGTSCRAWPPWPAHRWPAAAA